MYQKELVEILHSENSFFALLPFDPVKDKLVQLDFTDSNQQLTANVFNDITAFCNYIEAELNSRKAKYGIGGYAEHRTIYGRSSLFDAQLPGEEPRRLHLGMDIWGKALTAVTAPMDGYVHSFAFNKQAGDYGATLILGHELKGMSFYTLYGHLSLASIKNYEQGKEIRRADIIGELGVPSENGHWPPHLHFQVIQNLEGRSGDYPGVCKYSEKEYYLKNCPDPDLIAQMNRYINNGSQ